jgi:glycosyltransferase involved in cell wall biosynthesis
VAVSQSLRQRLWADTLRRKTTVIRDAVDFSLFRPLPQRNARERLSLAADEILVLFPHEVNQATKRVELAEAAVDNLRRVIPRARLWIVNGRPADEMPWYYAAADVMIVTSVREGGPSSAKEALACGLPVVSVRVGDVEMFQDAPEGMRQADATPESLADALRATLTTPRAEGVGLLPARFGIAEAARALIRVYEDALS